MIKYKPKRSGKVNKHQQWGSRAPQKYLPICWIFTLQDTLPFPPASVQRQRTTSRESADLVIHRLFGLPSGSGPADALHDFRSQLFNKNVLDKQTLSSQELRKYPVWRLEGGLELNADLVVNLRSQKCSRSPAFCPSQALAEGQDSEGVHLFCFSPPTLYCPPNHYWCSGMHVNSFDS